MSSNSKSRYFYEYLPIAPEGVYDYHFDEYSPVSQKLLKFQLLKLLSNLSDEFCWGILLDDFPNQYGLEQEKITQYKDIELINVKVVKE
jgi:hypothetical protein